MVKGVRIAGQLRPAFAVNLRIHPAALVTKKSAREGRARPESASGSRRQAALATSQCGSLAQPRNAQRHAPGEPECRADREQCDEQREIQQACQRLVAQREPAIGGLRELDDTQHLLAVRRVDRRRSGHDDAVSSDPQTVRSGAPGRHSVQL